MKIPSIILPHASIKLQYEDLKSQSRLLSVLKLFGTSYWIEVVLWREFRNLISIHHQTTQFLIHLLAIIQLVTSKLMLY